MIKDWRSFAYIILTIDNRTTFFFKWGTRWQICQNFTDDITCFFSIAPHCYFVLLFVQADIVVSRGWHIACRARKNVARRHRCRRSRDPLPARLPIYIRSLRSNNKRRWNRELRERLREMRFCNAASRENGAPVTRFKPFYIAVSPRLCDANSRRQHPADAASSSRPFFRSVGIDLDRM